MRCVNCRYDVLLNDFIPCTHCKVKDPAKEKLADLPRPTAEDLKRIIDDIVLRYAEALKNLEGR